MAGPTLGKTAAIEQPREARTAHRFRMSGKAAAAMLAGCFAMTAALIPMALRLPHWIEYEIVLAVWWAVWFTVLTSFLYRGRRVADDHQLRAPRLWFRFGSQDRTNVGSCWWEALPSVFDVDEPRFIAVVLAVVVAIIALVALVWFLVEIAIPVIMFLVYFVTRGMLARVVNDRHRCRGRLGRALAWGLIWSTLYTAPLAATVSFVHFAHRRIAPAEENRQAELEDDAGVDGSAGR